jgi:replicative DNA helicase
VYEQGFALQALDIIFSTIAYTPEQFAGIVHRLKQTHKIGIAFVDYLQLMRTRKHTENRQQEITNISQALKRIALRENIPIVALSQLNRQVDNRENHRPRLSDLRESGSLEQDADLVQFVYRDDYYRKDEPGFKPTGVAEIITAKNRRGRTGTTKLVFIHDYAKFSNLSKGW